MSPRTSLLLVALCTAAIPSVAEAQHHGGRGCGPLCQEAWRRAWEAEDARRALVAAALAEAHGTFNDAEDLTFIRLGVAFLHGPPKLGMAFGLGFQG